MTGCSSVRSFHCSDCNNFELLKKSTDKFAVRHLHGKIASYRHRVQHDNFYYEVLYDNCDTAKGGKKSRIRTCSTLFIQISKKTCKITDVQVWK